MMMMVMPTVRRRIRHRVRQRRGRQKPTRKKRQQSAKNIAVEQCGGPRGGEVKSLWVSAGERITAAASSRQAADAACGVWGGRCGRAAAAASASAGQR